METLAMRVFLRVFERKTEISLNLCLSFKLLISSLGPRPGRRGNQLGVAGWAAVADALERVTCLTRLNGCGDYAAIRAGGLRELYLYGTELGVWAARFLERSASTLTTLDVRCAPPARPSPAPR